LLNIFSTDQLKGSVTLSGFIDDFRRQITQLESDSYIYNTQLDEFKGERDFVHVKYILVGDSPGEIETRLNRYFAGESGTSILKILENTLQQETAYINHRFLILNKSSYSHINHTEEVLQDKYLQENQTYMATLVYLIYQKINESRSEDEKCQVFIFGDDDQKVYAHFYSQLAELFAKSGENNQQIYVFPHPMYGNLFTKVKNGNDLLNLKDDAIERWNEIKMK
jgi:hypothetical protein